MARHERTKAGAGTPLPQRNAMSVVAPLGRRKWSIATLTDTPDKRVRDQMIVSAGGDSVNPNAGVLVSLRIDNRLVVLDRPARRALTHLFRHLDHRNA